MSPRLLSRAAQEADGRSWFSGGAMVMGRAAAAPAGPTADDVEAGGNLAASLSYGDVALAGVGTATSVCDGEVVGFGHPLDFAGDDQTYGLHPAEAVYVQPDSLGAPFKVANLGDPVGTITDDHLTGITGTFGDVPDVITVQSDVTYGARQRLGTSYVSVPDALAEVAFYQNLGNHFTVVDEEAGARRPRPGPSRASTPTAARSPSPTRACSPPRTTCCTPRRSRSPTCWRRSRRSTACGSPRCSTRSSSTRTPSS